MNKLLLLTVFLAGWIPPGALSATADGQFAIRGAGLIDCETFLAEQAKQSEAYLMIGGWIDGYITGANQHAADTYDVTSFESTELFVEFLKNHCQDNPQDRLFAVVNSIIAQRWEHRMAQQSPLLRVRLGEFETQLYRDTLLRVQTRLAEKGMFVSKPTGQFDAETITAIAAFQDTLDGYEATGFPDQATLWALLAE